MPQIVDVCKLGKEKHEKTWLVQLATCTKRNVSEIVKDCEVNLNGFPTRLNVSILPLGSYDVLISMDSLGLYYVMLNFLHKSILCTDSEGNQVKIQAIPKKVLVRQIYALQAKKSIRKGSKLFAVNIRDIEAKREQCIDDIPVLVEFKDVFLKEIPRLPPK